jgi:cobalt-zinc-cadmium efflux system outer membrane protein
MSRRIGLVLLGGFASLTSVACASTSPNESFRAVSSAVEERSGHALYWNRGTPEDAQVDAAVDRLLASELGVEQAVGVALLNNRALTATYEELSISQADLVQAGLLRNPRFSAGMTTAEADRLDPNLELGITWDFLDLLMLPAKKKIAATQVEATRLRIADMVLDVVADVKRAHVDLVAAQQIAAMRKVVADAAEASAALASEQNAAGNMNDLSLANEQSASEQLALDLARAEAEVVEARERLARLLGLWGRRAIFRVADRLPDMPKEDPSLDHLESIAIAKRLDLESMRKERETLGRTLSLVKSSRFTPGIEIGANAARLDDGHIAVAPNASLELPIFDQKQAVIARLEAMFRAADDRLRARAVDIRSDVRRARERMQYARATVSRYRARVIPLRERVVALSQQRYDAMLLGVYQLLAAKQSEVNAYREAIEAARDYWLARVDLERTVAVRFPSPPPAASAPPPPAPTTHDHQHMNMGTP